MVDDLRMEDQVTVLHCDECGENYLDECACPDASENHGAPVRRCPNCQGHGRVRNSMSRYSVPCGRCDGRGTIPDEQPSGACVRG